MQEGSLTNAKGALRSPSRQPVVGKNTPAATKGLPQPIRRGGCLPQGQAGARGPKGQNIAQAGAGGGNRSGKRRRLKFCPSATPAARRHLPRTCCLTFACVLSGMGSTNSILALLYRIARTSPTEGFLSPGKSLRS